MPPTDSSYNFQVNLAGIIDILANHLYSEEKVFLRELLQNATDALTARRRIEPGFTDPAVRVDLLEADAGGPAQIVFEDNGIGLTEEEVHRFLSSIGASSKKSVGELTAREDFIGQFGIGLLSCFMVADEIVLVTRSATGESALEWRGNADGSYRIRHLALSLDPGTKVYLRAKQGVASFFRAEFLRELLGYYGGLLPFPIYFGEATTPLNSGTAPFLEEHPDPEALRTYGRAEFGINFFDAVPLATADGATRGVAYILPFTTTASSRTSHRVYLKRMLIGDAIGNVLPEWAFFVKAIVNTSKLRPTASRESFYEDETLEQTRRQLGQCIKDYLKQLATERPERMRQLVAIHFNSLKSLALDDDDFFDVIIDHLPFPTSFGEMRLGEVVDKSEELLHVSDIDEYRQLAGVAAAQRSIVINSGYIYNAQLVEKYGYRNRVAVRAVDTSHFIQRFDDLTVAEREATFDFLKRANAALYSFNCRAVLRKFEPSNVPTIYYMDAETGFQRSVQQSQQIATNDWASVLDSLADTTSYATNSQLCLNYSHPLIHSLSGRSDDIQLEVEILYVQALLLGHHPLNNEELNILSEGLLQLMNR